MRYMQNGVGVGIISAEATVNVFILLKGYFLVLCLSSSFHVGLTSRTLGNWFYSHLQVDSISAYEEIPVLLPPVAELVSCLGGPAVFIQTRTAQESVGLNVVSQLANSFPFLLRLT